MNAANGVFLHYVSRQFLVRFVGLLAFFVIVLQMLDLLNKSKEILAVEGAGWRSVVEYVALMAPQIASQFTPFAVLLAIVFTLSILNIRSEITVMRAAGMSIHRVIFPIGVVCAGIACVHFFLHEAFVVDASQKLAYWEANQYAVDLPPDTGTRTDIRLAYEGEFIHAASAARLGADIWLNDVTINKLSPTGLIDGEIVAHAARFQRGEWRLFDVRSFRLDDLTIRREQSRVWPTSLDPELVFALTVNPDRTRLGELRRKIVQLREDGADARAALTSFLARFSKPAATLVMPLLGALAGFGVRRQGAQLQRAVLGAGLGFSYFVAENMMLALGKLGAAPAVFGAFFPFALYMAVGFAILLAMEN